MTFLITRRRKYISSFCLSKYKKGDTVLEYDREGDGYYLILKGRVSVQIPTLIKTYLTAKEFMDYMQYNDVNTIEKYQPKLSQEQGFYPH